jgi:biopolymer transport protein ExbD
MKLSKVETKITEMDMTPMIDMTFQLIAFFMILLNFAEGEQNERIKLPASELAKPADAPQETPITLHVTQEGSVIIGGEELPVEALRPHLTAEASLMRLKGKTVADATIIIRGDRYAQTGRVQDLIRICQEAHFEKFILRAKEERR